MANGNGDTGPFTPEDVTPPAGTPGGDVTATPEGAAPGTVPAGAPTTTLEGGAPTEAEGLSQPSGRGNFMEIPGWLGGNQGPLGQILGAWSGMGGQQGAPPGANVQQRHGGFLTGLAGVLVEGLASGMAPSAEMAYKVPLMIRQQGLQQQQMQLEQQKMQEEMAMAPVKMNLELAQAHMYSLNAQQLAAHMGIEQKVGPAATLFAEKILEGGGGEEVATAPSYEQGAKALTQIQNENQDHQLRYFMYPASGDPNGKWKIYKTYPEKTLPEDINIPLEDPSPEHPEGVAIHLKAGTPTGTATFQGTAELHAYLQQRNLEQKFVPKGTVSFGQPVGMDNFGRQRDTKEYDKEQDQFNKTYADPLSQMNRTKAQFDSTVAKIRAWAKDPSKFPPTTGAELTVALFNAIGISVAPLKGSVRVGQYMIGTHEEARSLYQDLIQRVQKIMGSGGPVTPQQVIDYADMAQQAWRDAYITAGRVAIDRHLYPNFLPRSTTNENPSDDVMAIYLGIARGDPTITAQELAKAGYK